MTDFQHKLERIMRGDNVISEEEHKAVDKMFNWHIFDDIDQEYYDSHFDKTFKAIRSIILTYSGTYGFRYSDGEEKIKVLLKILYDRNFVCTSYRCSIDWEESIATGTIVRIWDKRIEDETDPKRIKTYITLCERSHLSNKVRRGLRTLRKIGYKHTKTNGDSIDWNKSMDAGILIYLDQSKS